MPHTGQLTINLATSSGDADLFVSNVNHKPTRENHQWRSRRFGSDFVSINAFQGYYYIGVYGFTNSTYRISATRDFDYLYPYGANMLDTVKKGEYRYFSSYIPSYYNGNQFFVGLTLISGSTEVSEIQLILTKTVVHQ
jgi:hypothetical protein